MSWLVRWKKVYTTEDGRIIVDYVSRFVRADGAKDAITYVICNIIHLGDGTLTKNDEVTEWHNGYSVVHSDFSAEYLRFFK